MNLRAVRRHPDSAPAVEVQVATRAVLPRGAALGRWVEATGARGAVTVRLVGAAESRRLNEKFRGKPGATNVLAFPAVLPASKGEFLGDLAICLPLVRREARDQGKSVRQHLAHLVIHGTLHLLGYDHDRSASARKMEAREATILARLGFPNPYRAVKGAARPARRRRPT